MSGWPRTKPRARRPRSLLAGLLQALPVQQLAVMVCFGIWTFMLALLLAALHVGFCESRTCETAGIAACGV